MNRFDGRKPDELRPIKITPGYLNHPPGSCLIEFGKTRVVCSAMIEDTLPPFLKNSGRGWLTAEYNMLPASSSQRVGRERTKVGGRTHEIQRLIGRALRMSVDMKLLGERSVLIDCDVIDADGGTRTAAITGSYVAMVLALKKVGAVQPALLRANKVAVAAVSVGMVKGVPCLDLNYEEDKDAEVDMNIVKTSENRFVEVQGTAESNPYSTEDLTALLQLADKGIKELIALQRSILG